jgi:type IV pilus assembly protein PilA
MGMAGGDEASDNERVGSTPKSPEGSTMLSKLQKRVNQEESGFTLIELLIVLVIIGILLAIAVPSYLGFKDRANRSAAQANVRSAVPAAEAFYADNGTYVGMTTASLTGIDAGVKATVAGTAPTATSYCIQAVSGSFTYRKVGPSGAITSGACT